MSGSFHDVFNLKTAFAFPSYKLALSLHESDQGSDQHASKMLYDMAMKVKHLPVIA